MCRKGLEAGSERRLGDPVSLPFSLPMSPQQLGNGLREGPGRADLDSNGPAGLLAGLLGTSQRSEPCPSLLVCSSAPGPTLGTPAPNAPISGEHSGPRTTPFSWPQAVVFHEFHPFLELNPKTGTWGWGPHALSSGFSAHAT